MMMRKRNFLALAVLFFWISLVGVSFLKGKISVLTIPKASVIEPSKMAHIEKISHEHDREKSDRGLDTEAISKWCTEVRHSFSELHWKLDPCEGIQWKVGGQSVEGRPLVYSEFGDSQSKNSTLIFAMVHGDEVTPLYLAIQLAQFLKGNPHDLEKARVVIAPLVNPDGFFKKPRSRTNARKVDLNRNFDTESTKKGAYFLWKTQFHSNLRRFPGLEAVSEPESVFQNLLIQKAEVQKIFSIHAPLDDVDIDLPKPARAKFSFEYIQTCKRLKKILGANSRGNFPGSLGKLGEKLGFPTVTLELPSANPTLAPAYWVQYQPRIRATILFPIPSYAASNPIVKPGG